MKKILALILALVMSLSLVACGGGDAAAEGEGEGEEAAAGRVYYLNFKPEFDEALQGLAKTYTEKTGVEVKVVTAASGTYSDTLNANIADVGENGHHTGNAAFCQDLIDVLHCVLLKEFVFRVFPGKVVG